MRARLFIVGLLVLFTASALGGCTLGGTNHEQTLGQQQQALAAMLTQYSAAASGQLEYMNHGVADKTTTAAMETARKSAYQAIQQARQQPDNTGLRAAAAEKLRIYSELVVKK